MDSGDPHPIPPINGFPPCMLTLWKIDHWFCHPLQFCSSMSTLVFEVSFVVSMFAVSQTKWIQIKSSWWFQPLRKRLVNMEIFPKWGVKTNTPRNLRDRATVPPSVGCHLHMSQRKNWDPRCWESPEFRSTEMVSPVMTFHHTGLLGCPRRLVNG